MIKPRKPNRLKVYDYSLPGYYFVTICTNDKGNIFGKVINEKMTLNKFGKIVLASWKKLSEMYSYCKLDYFQIMPDHFHGIIIINSVGTSRDLSLQVKTKSLSSLIGVFKTTSSKVIHLTGFKDFKWQRSFYDRIIRNEKELYNIRKYIYENPLRWEIEKNIPENLEFN
jgi:REP element-mobilizing transposase RayT